MAATDYLDWFNVGAEHGGYFPLVDFQRSNLLVSLKSVDTGGRTWMARMERHIMDLATRDTRVAGAPARVMLDLRVQPGGAPAAAPLIGFGQRHGVTVWVSEYP